MRARLALLFIWLVFIWPALSGDSDWLLAQTPLGVDDIVARVQQAFYYPGTDLKARVKMTLVSAGGETRLRDLTMLRRNGKGGEQQYFIYFYQPGDVRGMTFASVLCHKDCRRETNSVKSPAFASRSCGGTKRCG